MKTGKAETVEALSGAEFGVYVYSSEGRRRRGQTRCIPVSRCAFARAKSLRGSPCRRGRSFICVRILSYGYAFDKDTLIPVTGEEIVVQNEAQGELMITVQDALGKPISGVTLTASSENGEGTQLVTDENGIGQVPRGRGTALFCHGYGAAAGRLCHDGLFRWRSGRGRRQREG
ncbi:MAG: Ig-like domain-containing protein [Christensenellales bacterium]